MRQLSKAAVTALSLCFLSSWAPRSSGLAMLPSTPSRNARFKDNSIFDRYRDQGTKLTIHETSSRRDALLTAILAFGSVTTTTMVTAPAVVIADDTAGTLVRGTQVTPFNSLMFQYRGNDFDGLKAEDVGEPSISYKEFIDSMKAGQVSFVEFLAPYGDAAYATIKGKEQPIRVGEGYPIEQHDGYSSPAFAIRAVQNAGVPYKFTVPGLAKLASAK